MMVKTWKRGAQTERCECTLEGLRLIAECTSLYSALHDFEGATVLSALFTIGLHACGGCSRLSVCTVADPLIGF